MWAVSVLAESSKEFGIFKLFPAIIKATIVSPTALANPKIIALKTPFLELFKMRLKNRSSFVAPKLLAAKRDFLATCLKLFSKKMDMVGKMTKLSTKEADKIDNPLPSSTSFAKGISKKRATNAYKTVGTPDKKYKNFSKSEAMLLGKNIKIKTANEKLLTMANKVAKDAIEAVPITIGISP